MMEEVTFDGLIVSEKELNVLKDLYHYRLLTTEQIKTKHFSDSKYYVDRALYWLRNRKIITSSVYKGSRGKGKKGHTVHRLTETGLECLARHGMSVEVQSPQLYVRPNQMHYLTMANDVMVDLTLAGWEVWDSRKVKREYNLDKKMNISGLRRIREKQNKWRQKISIDEREHFTRFYEKFSKMRRTYFNGLSSKEVKQILMEQQAQENNTRKQTQTSVFSRSVYVKEFARKVSNGICRLCDQEAPFLDKQGIPFLEVHHIDYLSEGGSDSIDNVVAICPNCHRKIHQLELQENIKKIKERALASMNI